MRYLMVDWTFLYRLHRAVSDCAFRCRAQSMLALIHCSSLMDMDSDRLMKLLRILEVIEEKIVEEILAIIDQYE
jgi:hypothetical protein